MTISGVLRPDAAKLSQTADVLAIALAASLPWSTSATGILAGLWLLTFLPTLDFAALRRELAHPAAAVAVLLVALAALGILWSEATWLGAFQGFSPFWKLLVIPLLFIHFRRSERPLWVLGAFLISCAVLLVVSLALVAWPRPFGWKFNSPGIPVKDRIVQSGEFVLCAFGALYLALDYLKNGRRWEAMALAALSVAFLADVFYVAASRTSLVVIPVLLIFLGLRRFGWKGTLALVAAGGALGAVIWMSSPHLRKRVINLTSEIQAYETERKVTSAGQRLDYWKHSLDFIAEAPVIGHGSGTIRQLFEKTAGGIRGWETANPHNQTLAVAIQLGIVGVLILWALWLSHFLLFRNEAGLAAWVGEIVVVQNIVSSLFNSHLFDFTQGWIYVLGVGVAGGMILRRRAAAESGANTQRPL